jgi:adenylate cyclase
MADVQGFTTISEKENPSTVLNWLNELFGELVPIITSFGGVVNEFSGDAMFTFFGILPRPLDGAESAYLACRAAVEMLAAVGRINERRESRGDPLLNLGIGINTGPVTAGGLGAEDRLHYTIIGDTVNTAQRIEALAHQFGESGIMVSKQTLIALWDKRDNFNLEAQGVYIVKGKEEKLLVYRLWPAGVDVSLDVEMVDLVQ